MAVGWDFVVDAKRHVERFDLERAARAMTARQLIVHGDADMAVPAEEADVLRADRADPQCRQIFVQNGTHTFGAVHPFEGTTSQLDEAISQTRAWIDPVLEE